MKFIKPINSFSSGELSPKVRGRTDSPAYSSGLRTMLNALPYRSGGGFKRPGTEYLFTLDSATGVDHLGDATDTNSPARLLPYIYNNDSYIVVVRNVNAVDNGGNPSGANSNIRIFRHDKLAGTFSEKTIVCDWSYYKGLTLEGFNFTQVGDVLIIAHVSGTVPPVYLIPSSTTPTFHTTNHGTPFYSPSLGDYGLLIPVWQMFPYLPENTITTLTMTPSVTTGNGTLTASSAYFDATHVGSRFRVIHGAVEGVAVVTAFTSATIVDITVEVDFGATTASNAFSEVAWSAYRGWPRIVSFHQDRVCYGGTPFRIDTVYFSRTSFINFFAALKLVQDATTDVSGNKFFGPITIDDAFNVIPAGARANRISWMTPGTSLNVGTSGGEFTIRSSGAFGGASVEIEHQTAHGGEDIQAALAANMSLFISRDGKRLRGFRYSEENGSFIAPDLSILSDHIYRHFDTFENNVDKQGFLQIEWHEGLSTLWAKTSHGALAGLTLDTTANVAGWHRHTLEGAFVHSLAALSAVETEDLYLLTGRTIDSTLVYSIERLSSYFDRDTFAPVRAEDDQAFYMDFAAKAVLTGGTTYRAAHLPSTEVRVVGDGVDLGLKTLDASGDVDLTANYTNVLMGLTYKMVMRTYKLETGSKLGSAQIAPQRIDKLLLRIYRSLSGKYGWTEGRIWPIDYTKIIGDNGTDWAKTGDFMTEFPDGSYKEDRSLYFEDESPFPLNILMIEARGYTQD